MSTMSRNAGIPTPRPTPRAISLLLAFVVRAAPTAEPLMATLLPSGDAGEGENGTGGEGGREGEGDGGDGGGSGSVDDCVTTVGFPKD